MRRAAAFNLESAYGSVKAAEDAEDFNCGLQECQGCQGRCRPRENCVEARAPGMRSW